MRIEQVLLPTVRQVIQRPRLADILFRFDPFGNPFSDAAVADPMILAPKIRAQGPVYWHRLYQQWFISGYDEARQVLASPHVGTAHQMDVLLDVRPYTKLRPTARSMLRNLMLLTDPPQHTRLRGLVNRAFTPRQVSRLEPMMASMVEELLAEFDDEIELVTDFAVPFPAMVISELFGFERKDWLWLRDLSTSLTKIVDPIRAFDPAEVDHAAEELRDRVLELAERRRANPTDDLMSGLALAEAEDGDRLSEDELVSVSALILFAGHETTSNMIGLSAMMLRQHPEQ
ncbi:MAG: cytochrome P450, partial [Acidimicrobiales bacterium]